MKLNAKSTCAILTITMLLVSVALADTCERLAKYELLMNETSVNADLTNGIWQADLHGAESVLFFHEEGVVEVLRDEEGGDEYDVDTWDVSYNDHGLTLTISGNGEPETQFTLLPTCDGFMLLSKCGEQTALVKGRDNVKSLVEQMRSQMQGAWITGNFKSRKKKPDLQWTFAENGTFQCQCRSGHALQQLRRNLGYHTRCTKCRSVFLESVESRGCVCY